MYKTDCDMYTLLFLDCDMYTLKKVTDGLDSKLGPLIFLSSCVLESQYLILLKI